MYSSNKEIGFPIIVNYYTKNRILFKEKLNSKNTFNSLLEIYEKNNKYKNEAKLKSKYFINGIEIKRNQLLEELIEKKDYQSSELVEFSLELEELYYLNDSKYPSYKKIIQPKSNPFGLLIVYPKEKKISLKTYPDKIISLFELNKINKSSSYCNSLNDIYISEEKDFWSIDNNDFKIKKKNMPSNKRNHSMLFLNGDENNEWVFILGGEDKKSFYYDINKNYFINWGETNEIHFKPALIIISEYLYIFDSINLNNNFFERTKIASPIRKWEKIYLNLNEKKINNFPSKFGISFDSNGNILFLGGDNINKENNTFIYMPGNNIISISQKGTNDNIIFDDKTFYKINNKYNIALPHDLYESKEISVVDKEEQSLIKINIECPIDDNDTNIKCNISFEENIENNNNNDIGNLTIKTSSSIEANKNNNNKINECKEQEQINYPTFICDNCIKNKNIFVCQLCHNSYKTEELKKDHEPKERDENKISISKENPRVTIIYDEYFPTLNKKENFKIKHNKKSKNKKYNTIKDKSNVEIVYDEYIPIKVDYELSKPGEIIKYIPKKHKRKKNNKNKEEKINIENINHRLEGNLNDKENGKNEEEEYQLIKNELNYNNEEINEEDNDNLISKNNEIFNGNSQEVKINNKNEEEIEINQQANKSNNEDENKKNEISNEINYEGFHSMNEDENGEEQNNYMEYIENGNDNNNVEDIEESNEENQIVGFDGEEINVEEKENGEEINSEEMNLEGQGNEEEMEEENNNEEKEDQNSINDVNHNDNNKEAHD